MPRPGRQILVLNVFNLKGCAWAHGLISFHYVMFHLVACVSSCHSALEYTQCNGFILRLWPVLILVHQQFFQANARRDVSSSN